METKKYQVMIVEDEILLRESIAKKINAFSPEFNIIATAADGSEALSLLDECKPDIIITDIVMPVMNGLEFISKAVELNIDAQFVVLSGYDDFEYAKIAMQYGVRDYLLKPLSEKVLHELLIKLSKDIDHSTDMIAHAYTHSLLDSTPTQDIIDLYCGISFQIILICIGNYVYQSFSHECEEYFDSYWQSIDICKVSSQINKEYSEPLVYSSANSNERILVFKNQDFHPIQIKKYTNQLSTILNSNPYNLPVSICYSSLNLQAKELAATLKKLRKLYHFNYKLWNPQCFELSDSDEPLFLRKHVNAVKTDNITQHLLNGKMYLARKELYNTLNSWLQSGISSDRFLKNLQYLLYSLRQSKPDINQSTWDELYQNIYLCFTISYDYESFFNELFGLIEKHYILHSEDIDNKQTMEKVKNYIDENFNRPISIFDIANRFHISSSHLSRLFKSIYMQSPVKYLIALRIQEACKLMMQYPDLELKYISELIGYTDQHYFSKLFKKHVGLSPTKYRAKKKSNEYSDMDA